VKLASVASNVVGKSARAMIELLLAGSMDVARIPQLAKGKLRLKIPQLEQALAGEVGPHQRLLIAQQLAHIDFVDDAIEHVNAEIQERMGPYQEDLDRLDTIPGVGRKAAEEIIAQIGVDMSRFPTHRRLASWAGMCPGNNEARASRRAERPAKATGRCERS
jgi:transposase